MVKRELNCPRCQCPQPSCLSYECVTIVALPVSLPNRNKPFTQSNKDNTWNDRLNTLNHFQKTKNIISLKKMSREPMYYCITYSGVEWEIVLLHDHPSWIAQFFFKQTSQRYTNNATHSPACFCRCFLSRPSLGKVLSHLLQSYLRLPTPISGGSFGLIIPSSSSSYKRRRL